MIEPTENGHSTGHPARADGHRSRPGFLASRSALEHDTGIVVPVYVPDAIDRQVAERIVEDTVAGCCSQVSDPARVCISVDGPGTGAEIAERLAEALGASTVLAPTNRGKLAAVRNGACKLLARRDVGYLAIVDQDGDHFPNELVNLIRAARHVLATSETPSVLVLGCRSSRHRPMGFLRGEQEELADRMLLDALHYHAAMSGHPLRMEYVSTVAPLPDFHSGYKLFSRECAASVFLTEPKLAGLPADCCFRHAVEAVMVVEAIVAGGLLAAVNRSTLNVQPISTFGAYERCQLVADMIVWPCKRLGVPARFVAQWLANHMEPLLLGTLAPQGGEEMNRIADLVLHPFRAESSLATVGSRRPSFV